jgi:hypothetical protein
MDKINKMEKVVFISIVIEFTVLFICLYFGIIKFI